MSCAGLPAVLSPARPWHRDLPFLQLQDCHQRLEERPQHMPQSAGEGSGQGHLSPALLQGQGQGQHWSLREDGQGMRNKQSPSTFLVFLQPLLTRISGSPGPLVSQAPAGGGLGRTVHSVLASLASGTVPGSAQPWLAVPAQMPGTWLSQRMLSCEQRALGYFCCTQALPLCSSFPGLCLDNSAGHGPTPKPFYCMTESPQERGAGESQGKATGSARAWARWRAQATLVLGFPGFSRVHLLLSQWIWVHNPHLTHGIAWAWGTLSWMEFCRRTGRPWPPHVPCS